MKRSVLVSLIVSVLTLGGAGTALAAEPAGGPAFGRHVAGMAPEHPIEHGAHFGACVSAMARTGCPHQH